MNTFFNVTLIDKNQRENEYFFQQQKQNKTISEFSFAVKFKYIFPQKALHEQIRKCLFTFERTGS